MAGIDYTIPSQFKPIQLESPMNAMAQVMQLRGLQEAAQMNALKMQEYQQQQQEKNALARIYGNPNLKYGSPEFFSAISQHAPSFYEKIATGEEKRQAAEAQRQLALSTQQTRDQQRQEETRKQQLARRAFGYRKIATAEDYGQAANLIERSVREGEISREEGDDMLSRLTPDSDIKQFRNNVLQNMLEPEKALEELRATEKHAFTLDKEKTDKFERRLKLYQSVVPSVNTIDGVAQIVSAMYQDPDLEPILSQIRPYADALNANLDLFNQDSENWKLTSSGVNPKDIIEAARNKIKTAAEEERKQADRTAPKPEKYELGGKVVTFDMNPLSSTFNQQIRSDEKTAAPAAVTESPLARLERERAEIAAKNPNDPRLKSYDEAISKETGGTPPEIVREYEYARKNNQIPKTMTLLQFKERLAQAGRPLSLTQAAPTITMVLDPADPTRMLSINAREYRGGSLGSPGVIGIAGKEPTVGKKQEAKEAAQDNAGNIIAQLRQSFDRLDELGGITSTQNRVGTNVLAGLSSSGLGQATGRLFGTEVQSERNKIQQTRPLLMTTIMQAMGISAKQLDSNAELKLWLSAATDPTLDLQANRSALANLERMLTNKNAAAAAPKPTTTTPSAPAVGTVKDGYRFKGGNPADKNNWEKVK